MDALSPYLGVVCHWSITWPILTDTGSCLVSSGCCEPGDSPPRDSKPSGLSVNLLWRNNRHSLLEGPVGGKNFRTEKGKGFSILKRHSVLDQSLKESLPSWEYMGWWRIKCGTNVKYPAQPLAHGKFWANVWPAKMLTEASLLMAKN